MAAIIIASVACRIRDLRGGMRSGMSLDAAIKLSQETKTTILKVVFNYPRELSLDTASALIRCISQDMEMFSPECRQTLIDSIISKTLQSDVGWSSRAYARMYTPGCVSISMVGITGYSVGPSQCKTILILASFHSVFNKSLSLSMDNPWITT